MLGCPCHRCMLSSLSRPSPLASPLTPCICRGPLFSTRSVTDASAPDPIISLSHPPSPQALVLSPTYKHDIYDRVAAEFMPILREIEFMTRTGQQGSMQSVWVAGAELGGSQYGEATTGVFMDPDRWMAPPKEGSLWVPVRIVGAGTGERGQRGRA